LQRKQVVLSAAARLLLVSNFDTGTVLVLPVLPTMTKRTGASLCGLIILLVLPSVVLTAQDKPAATFSSSVKVVNVFATVRDKKGNIIKDLAKEDFKLLDDGQPQTIRYFTRETDLPLTLGLLVDTSMSQRRMIDQERTASYAFLNEFMRPEKDKAFVMHFDWGTELLQDLTANHQKLEAALNKLDMPQPPPDPEDPQTGAPGSGYPKGGKRQMKGGSTTLYDAVYLASDEFMKKQEGRKAIILLTDGVDEGSKTSLDRAIEAAQRSDTLIYTIYYSDPEAYGHQRMSRAGGAGAPGGGYPGGGYPGGGYPGGGYPGGGYPGGGYPGGGYPGGGYPGGGQGGGQPQQPEQHADGKKVLQRMSRETGGRFFEISKKEPIDKIYDQIGEELRNQYSIGYTPDKAAARSGYHKLSVETTNKEYIVQAREGYYAEQ
jgi:VWFA-related protein